MIEIIGLKRKTLELVPFNSEWKNIFQNEKDKILKGLKKNIITIEHIGSTSIENIYSKPIIDICISIENYDYGFKCISYLESIGYIYRGDFGIPGRHFFRTNDEIVRFHIHMFERENINYRNHLYFRDYLKKYPKEAKKYERLKLKLYKKYNNNRDLYTKKKGNYIKKIIKKAEFEFK